MLHAPAARAAPATTSSTQWFPVVTTAIVIAPGTTYATRPRVRAPAAAASRVQHTWKLGIAAYGSNQPLGWATAPSGVAPSWSSSAPVRRGGATG